LVRRNILISLKFIMDPELPQNIATIAAPRLAWGKLTALCIRNEREPVGTQYPKQRVDDCHGAILQQVRHAGGRSSQGPIRNCKPGRNHTRNHRVQFPREGQRRFFYLAGHRPQMLWPAEIQQSRPASLIAIQVKLPAWGVWRSAPWPHFVACQSEAFRISNAKLRTVLCSTLTVWRPQPLRSMLTSEFKRASRSRME
jgi:hypothetical protein